MKFRNQDGSGPPKVRDILGWAFRSRPPSPSRSPAPSLKPDLALLSHPPTPGAPARLTWLGHASWLVQLEGTSLLIDPVQGNLSGILRRNVPAPLPTSALPPITACLVSHNHRDHLDRDSLSQIGAPVIAGTGTGATLRGLGLACTELGWWSTTQLGPLRIHLVPAQHWSRHGVADTNQALWGGFVIEGGGVRLYHAGDSAYFPGFQEIGRRFPGLDAAMLPIGAYQPGWFMEKQHMNPEQSVQAFLDLGARRFFAMHWGTFKLSDEPLDEPPRRLQAAWAQEGLEPVRLCVLPIGGTSEVKPPPAAPPAG